MKRLSSAVTQKHLRTLALRHGMQENNAVERIESPLMKVDSNGNFSCIICRTPLKSANIWKVHINSKAHKNNVQAAKELKSTILSTKNLTRQNAVVLKSIKQSQAKGNSIKQIVVQEKDALKNEQSSTAGTLDPLPETFFDSTSKDTKGKHLDKDTEWQLFQKEIKEVSEAPTEIFVGDQKDMAVEKEIEEIDEQIQHWSKVLDLEEKRKKLSNKMIEKIKSIQKSNQSGDESSEGEDFEEYTDWRSKVFK